MPRLKAHEIRRLQALAAKGDGLAVISTVQPITSAAFLTGNFGINFYDLESWSALDPTGFLVSDPATPSAELPINEKTPDF